MWVTWLNHKTLLLAITVLKGIALALSFFAHRPPPPLPPDPSESGLLIPLAVEWKFVVLLRWILAFKQAMRLQRRLVRSSISQEKRLRQSVQRPIKLSTERTAARARGNSPEPPRGPMVGVEHANA